MRGELRGSSLPHGSKKEALTNLRVAFPAHSMVSACFSELQEALVQYFDGESVSFRVRCDWSRVTPFQKDVYQALRRVRSGQLVTYGELAQRAGHPGAARGVGVAMAKNPFAPFVPCHRVVASGGSLGGFSAAGGLDTKRLMLELEGHELTEAGVVTSDIRGR